MSSHLQYQLKLFLNFTYLTLRNRKKKNFEWQTHNATDIFPINYFLPVFVPFHYPFILIIVNDFQLSNRMAFCLNVADFLIFHAIYSRDYVNAIKVGIICSNNWDKEKIGRISHAMDTKSGEEKDKLWN